MTVGFCRLSHSWIKGLDFRLLLADAHADERLPAPHTWLRGEPSWEKRCGSFCECECGCMCVQLTRTRHVMQFGCNDLATQNTKNKTKKTLRWGKRVVASRWTRCCPAFEPSFSEVDVHSSAVSSYLWPSSCRIAETHHSAKTCLLIHSSL